MARESTLRFGAQTDEVTSLLRIVNMVRTGDASTRPEIGRVTGLGRGVVTDPSPVTQDAPRSPHPPTSLL